MSTALSESTCTTDGQLKINADRKTNGPPPCCPCHRNINNDNIDLIRSTKQTLTGCSSSSSRRSSCSSRISIVVVLLSFIISLFSFYDTFTKNFSSIPRHDDDIRDINI